MILYTRYHKMQGIKMVGWLAIDKRLNKQEEYCCCCCIGGCYQFVSGMKMMEGVTFHNGIEIHSHGTRRTGMRRDGVCVSCTSGFVLSCEWARDEKLFDVVCVCACVSLCVVFG